ncbi:energy-coupling factor transporter transmembrane protein EcfT [Corynebacterium sp. CCM 9185]|uniref:Energy-coupling factor transporter transmembrane protein EcfT n=1 Tax=Corynebacterium marambiense TaxID=2765364 RepID=A0ABS0VYF3_9CORY|nr:energy-coupling factor transporter transmembrane protein EcfT [Corynebacterium marambiense]MBI9000665.1 energy-coupling factor transporter transmembrane protein EcfT [Corynebacterium marambiense]MCK7663072.1 energy-coupling factor transporter transmembrane protein EcfT [Corynebacterium marambiense]MCX7542686.1 energy-coupling factor transporter transmembrane protein EcfT [Corynebacterium marambiense]
MSSIPMGVYVPGNTPVHRMNPTWKFLLLIAYIITSTALIHSLRGAVGCLLAVILLITLARIPVRIAWGQIWPALPLLGFFAAFQWWQQGFEPAAVVFLLISSSIMAATLLTLTTRVSAMMEALEDSLRPLERFGFPAAKISLAMSLTIRLIPLQLATVREVLDARKARGATMSVAAFGTPVIIRSIRRAQRISDALLARGVDD